MSWRDQARCSGAGLGLFFAEGKDSRRAKAFCAGCAVWSQCLAHGLDEDHGVWGGLNPAERACLRKLRHRLAVDPTSPANAVDVRRLLAAGMAPERLSELASPNVETIVALASDRTGRQRR